jgi:hypothetical protein
MGAPADHSDVFVNAVHPSSRGPRLRPGRGTLGTRTGRGPLGCDPARPDRSEKPQPAERLINVNTATTAEPEVLPGIGPVLALRIIEGRPYRSVEELERVKGIGPKRLGEIRPLVRLE